MRFLVEFSRGTPPKAKQTIGGMEVVEAPPELIAALQAAHARDHELVQQLQHAQQALAEGRAALEAQNDLLRTRTIERDHHAQDAHLWACIIAYIVKEDGIASLPMDGVNAMEGIMLSADVRDERVWLSLAERPQASDEGRDG